MATALVPDALQRKGQMLVNFADNNIKTIEMFSECSQSVWKYLSNLKVIYGWPRFAFDRQRPAEKEAGKLIKKFSAVFRCFEAAPISALKLAWIYL